MTSGPPAPPQQLPGRRVAAGTPRRFLLRRRVLLGLGVVAGLAVGALLYGVAWYEGVVHAGPPGAATVVEVPSGSSVQEVARHLSDQGVISSSLALRVYFVLHGTPVVRAGGYGFRKNESLAAVRSTLEAGPDVLVVPAGFTVAETADRLDQLPGQSASALLAAVASRAVVSRYEPPGAANLDGLLGTGDYVLSPGERATTLLAQMVERFDAQAHAAGLDAGAAALGVTPYQAVTIASIVQKEGVYPQNLAKVSRVVYNRLVKGMRLQMDSTVLYSEHRDGGPVTSADLALDTPYNTYLHGGLPPTPICFPSAASLSAALHPAAGDWLYFVLVSNDGTEAFSDTLAGQLANEQLAKSRGLG
ncbi:MAG: endolytic transglycosylase MltG [Acidimicrobiales bacterium]